MRIESWRVEQAGQPMVLAERVESAGPAEVLVEVAGCGVCHTDLGFFYDGVPTRQPLPLTLGHEIAGRVVEAGAGAEAWLGRAVIVPAVIPCGECAACREGHGSICPRQLFPGNDRDGGFGTAVRVPASGLCPVPDLASPERNPAGLTLPDLAVIADAVSTPFQAALRAGLAPGDLAVFVGAGGVGGFGVQVAAAMGASVVAIDVRTAALERAARHGASATFDAASLEPDALRKAVRALAKQLNVPSWRVKVFETSGSPAGQQLAFALLGHGGYLSVVGYTPASVELRLSNLMALDATARGNWGCLPEHYPAILDLVLAGRVELRSYVEHRPLATINEVFAEVHAGGVDRRIVLVPER